MRTAIIDLGTNTFNLLIAEIKADHSFETLYHEKLAVKLGEGGINKDLIAEAAFLRGLEAMENYFSVTKQWNVDKILAFATSSIRNATNGKEFVDAVKSRTGIDIEIIPGEKEAELIAKGVKLAVKLSDHPSLIIDIGGGSTEFIIMNNEKILWKQSFEIGASRLLQKFNPSDLITEEERKKIFDYLIDVLQPLWIAGKKYGVNELIGASGSFESLASIVNAKHGLFPDIDEITECEFEMEQCAVIHEEILASTRAQRMQMKGLIAMRVDLIVISAILVETVVTQLEIKKMRYSAYALKEGVLSELLQQQKNSEH
ncbi:MAG: phosphatase [Bacteroidetes bacterium]|nr:phosphatase [Bacteroidota bacterium]